MAIDIIDLGLMNRLIGFDMAIIGWVVEPYPSESYMFVRQLGSVKFPTEWKIKKAMFQTTNHYVVRYIYHISPQKSPTISPVYSIYIYIYHLYHNDINY